MTIRFSHSKQPEESSAVFKTTPISPRHIWENSRTIPLRIMFYLSSFSPFLSVSIAFSLILYPCSSVWSSPGLGGTSGILWNMKNRHQNKTQILQKAVFYAHMMPLKFDKLNMNLVFIWGVNIKHIPFRDRQHFQEITT